MKRYWFILLLLYFIGLSTSLYLVSLSITQSSPFCELFGSDCAAVALSSYGSFKGFSTASFGLCYFIIQLTFLAFLIASTSFQSTEPINPAPALLLNLLACGASLTFLAILVFALHQNCIACMIVHAVNFMTLPFNLYFWVKGRETQRNLSVTAIALLLGLNTFLIVNIIDTRFALNQADRRTFDFLELALGKYDEAQKFLFTKEMGDAIYGEPEVALHQVVLIYKENCPNCKQAKAKLIDLTAEHYQSIYLLTINFTDLTKKQLQEINVKRVPAVFVDGKRAIGWAIKGFMDTFFENCDC